MLTQTRTGAIEMFTSSGSVLDNLVPIASMENIGFAYPDQRTAFRALDGDLGARIRAEFPAKGFFAFERAVQNGFRHFTTSTKPIRNAEDLQGVKMRVVPGRLAVDTFRSLGTAPTPVDGGALYTSLQTRLVDGQESPLTLIETFRLFEVQKYCSLSRHMWTSNWLLVSNERWNGLPATYQGIVRKHMNESAIRQRRACELQEGTERDILTRQGLLFNEVNIPSLKARLSSSGYYSRWRNEFGASNWSILEKYVGPLA
jgi:tripartite ATP-independent transporter DctP family solute receptor